MKVGDLVKENWGLERVGLVISPVRRSTPRDNYELGVMYGDNHRVNDVIISGTGKREWGECVEVLWNTAPMGLDQKGTAWVRELEVISEAR
jgi:hypothetical protein